jgi:hypothetical protein
VLFNGKQKPSAALTVARFEKNQHLLKKLLHGYKSPNCLLYFRHPSKQGKPVERPGRKASGLKETGSLTAAGPPSEAKSSFIFWHAWTFEGVPMIKLITAILLLLPALAHAECGFTRSGNSMTIVVGKNAKCLSSESFRGALKADIAEALDEVDAVRANEQQRRAFDDRNARSAKLWTIAERRHQEVGGTYFGQKR